MLGQLLAYGAEEEPRGQTWLTLSPHPSLGEEASALYWQFSCPEEGARSVQLLLSHARAEKLETMEGSSRKAFRGRFGGIHPLKFDEEGATVLLNHQPFNGNWIQESREGIPDPTLSNATSLRSWTTDLRGFGSERRSAVCRGGKMDRGTG